jgi:hypothetical protein
MVVGTVPQNRLNNRKTMEKSGYSDIGRGLRLVKAALSSLVYAGRVPRNGVSRYCDAQCLKGRGCNRSAHSARVVNAAINMRQVGLTGIIGQYD